MKILNQKEGEECCYLNFKQKNQGENSNPDCKNLDLSR